MTGSALTDSSRAKAAPTDEPATAALPAVCRLGLVLIFVGLAVESSFASGRYTALSNIAPPLYAFGREVWTVVGGVYIPWILLIALGSWSVIAEVVRRRIPVGVILSVLGIVLLLLVLCVYQGARNFLLALLPFVAIAATAALLSAAVSRAAGRTALVRVLLAVNAITVFRALVAVTAPTGDRFVPFYDGASIVLAGACLVSSLAFQAPHRQPLFWVSSLAFVLSGAIGSRRASLVALVLAMVFVVVVGRGRTVFRARVAAALVVAGAVIFAAVGSRITEGLATLVNNAGEKSTNEHIDDVYYGSYLCRTRASLMSGVGPRHPQINGLASTEGKSLYIHNEYWQVCVGSGHLAMVLLVLALVAVLVLSTLALRRSRETSDPLVYVGVIVLVGLPVVLIWFPYLSTGPRWPILVGVALGIILGMRRVDVDGERGSNGARLGSFLDRAAS